MGHGIAYIFAAAGNRVSIYDPAKLALSSVVGRISEIFELLEQPPDELDNIYIFENLEKAIEVMHSKDKKDFHELTEHEQHIFTANLKRQIMLDSVQGRAPNLAFLPIASLPEI